jgi:alcohol dehydrogenase (NADP+)
MGNLCTSGGVGTSNSIMKKREKSGNPSELIEVPPAADNEYREVAWGIQNDGDMISPFWVNKPKVGENDVKIEMKYCGICHTDCHFALNELGGAIYPMVPGHELVGTVVEVGANVTKVKVGDNAGVGCMIDSCMECGTCDGGDEQYCENGGSVLTYNSKKNHKRIGGNPDT